MNFKVFLLAASTIAVGLVELIVGGNSSSDRK